MDDLREAVQDDGSLQLIGSGYISWRVGDDEIVLDGRYTLEQLEFIVAHMKNAQQSVHSDAGDSVK